MSIERIRDVVRSNGLSRTLDAEIARSGGVYHRSAQRLADSVRYQATVPAGIHLSCGLARLSTTEPDFGTIAFDTAGMTAMLCEEDRPHFMTNIDRGDTRSCGFFMPLDVDHTITQLHDIREILAAGAPMRGTARIPARLIARACEPIDPWFQGAARALATEARALELTALVWTWLTNTAESPPTSRRQRALADAVLEIVEADLLSPTTLAELAARIGCNVRTMTTAFRQSQGSSIAAYVTRRRLEHARGLLGQGMSVDQAAFEIGYSTPYFSRAFLQAFGIRPNAARR